MSEENQASNYVDIEFNHETYRNDYAKLSMQISRCKNADLGMKLSKNRDDLKIANQKWKKEQPKASRATPKQRPKLVKSEKDLKTEENSIEQAETKRVKISDKISNIQSSTVEDTSIIREIQENADGTKTTREIETSQSTKISEEMAITNSMIA